MGINGKDAKRVVVVGIQVADDDPSAVSKKKWRISWCNSTTPRTGGGMVCAKEWRCLEPVYSTGNWGAWVVGEDCC